MDENSPHAIGAAVVAMIARSVVTGVVRVAGRRWPRRFRAPGRAAPIDGAKKQFDSPAGGEGAPTGGGTTIEGPQAEPTAAALPRDQPDPSRRSVRQRARASGRSRVQQAGGDITTG